MVLALETVDRSSSFDPENAVAARRREELVRALVELIGLTRDADGPGAPTLDAATLDLPPVRGIPPSRFSVVVLHTGTTADAAARVVAEANAPGSALRRFLRRAGGFVALHAHDDGGYGIAVYLPWRDGRPPYGSAAEATTRVA